MLLRDFFYERTEQQFKLFAYSARNLFVYYIEVNQSWLFSHSDCDHKSWKDLFYELSVSSQSVALITNFKSELLYQYIEWHLYQIKSREINHEVRRSRCTHSRSTLFKKCLFCYFRIFYRARRFVLIAEKLKIINRFIMFDINFQNTDFIEQQWTAL